MWKLEKKKPFSLFAILFPELRSPWPAVGKWELWEQPFWNNKGNNPILVIPFIALSAQSAFFRPCLKWLLPELSFSERWSSGTKLWHRDCLLLLPSLRMFDRTMGAMLPVWVLTSLGTKTSFTNLRSVTLARDKQRLDHITKFQVLFPFTSIVLR